MEQPDAKSGYVAVLGKPNVGKSTLINRILRQKVAAVSTRPQTTIRKQLGIHTETRGQIVFIDTPGIHKPVDSLGKSMVHASYDALRDADLLLWLVDGSHKPDSEDQLVAEAILKSGSSSKVLLVLNKTDLIDLPALDKRDPQFLSLIPGAEVLRISAAAGTGVDILLSRIFDLLKPGPLYFDPEQVTDLYEKEITRDYIREAVLSLLRDEVPYSTAVRIDEYHDQGEDRASIAATLLVERESQKGILIGKSGEMIKKIGTLARTQIEELTGRKVYLELKVKVLKNWRDDPASLKTLGFSRMEEE